MNTPWGLTHLAEGFEAESAASGEVGQAVGLEVDLYLRARFQLLAQPLVRLARVQLAAAGPQGLRVRARAGEQKPPTTRWSDLIWQSELARFSG
jgi:hypothetical protein